MLQWGRDREVADSLVDAERHTWGIVACFNGAATVRSRIASLPNEIVACAELLHLLQWGRDREVADSAGHPDVSTACASPVLQWGRDREVADRRDVGKLAPHEASLAGFNGAATVRSRIDRPKTS